VRRFVDLAVDKVLFSINGPDESTDEYHRSSGSFKRSIAGLEMLARAKAGTHLPWIVVTPVLTSKNYEKIPELIEMCVRLDVEQLHFQPVMVRKDGYRHLLLENADPARFDSVLEGAIRLADRHGLIHNLLELPRGGDDVKACDRTRCFFPWSSIYIAANGAVAPCPMLDKDASACSVDDGSLESIWCGSYFNRFRSVISGNYDRGMCEGCCPSNMMFNKKIEKEISSR